MKLIVGLGNPGDKYKNNRHNAGHMFIDYLINELPNSAYKSGAMKTDCFMNVSGDFVKKIIHTSNFTIDDLIIVHDDLDIPLGKFRIHKGTGPQLHNGIKSIENRLGTKEFWRVRIGIENRQPAGGSENKMSGETYVLQDFKEEEIEIINKLFPVIFERLKELLTN